MDHPNLSAGETPVQPRSIAELQALGRELAFLASGRCPHRELILQGLVPPLPVCEAQLLWGFPVLEQAAALGLKRLLCRPLPGLSRPERLAAALRLENRPGAFSWAEKLAMRRYLEASADRADVDPELAALSPLIEAHPEPQLPRRLERYACLPPELREEVDRARIDLKTALRVRRLPDCVLRLAADAPLSFSQRRDLLHGLVELTGRDGLSDEEAAAVTRDILRARQPLQELEARRLPIVSDLRRRFQRISQAALAGSGVRLRPPPWFEGDAFEVDFSFSTCRSLRRRLQGLVRLAEHCDELLQLLG